jgi:hypothetical protein
MLNKVLAIIVIILSIMVMGLIGGAIYLISNGVFFNWFYHDILKWHLPDYNSLEFDGCNLHAHCKFCNKEITMDSQGNWF